MEKQWEMATSLGTFYLLASASGLSAVGFKKFDIEFISSLTSLDAQAVYLNQAVQQISEYLQGVRKEFNLTLDFHGTPFQKKVWQQLAYIPYGETRSYKEIAFKINQPDAVRAVGTANGKNPLCLVIPCHRVISSDGSLGGYSGGLLLKNKLLQIEKSLSEQNLTF